MTAHHLTDNDRDWSLDTLNRAYQQGYMAGLAGNTQRPRQPEVLAAAWEAGWDDGHEQYQLHLRRRA